MKMKLIPFFNLYTRNPLESQWGKYLGFPDFLGNSIVLERNLLEEWVPIQREKVAAILPHRGQ
jgi:hypothetical protein